MFRRPFMFAFAEPLAGNGFKGMGLLECRSPLPPLFLGVCWVIAGCENLPGLEAAVTGVAETDFRVDAQCQQLFLATEEVFQAPVFAAGGRNLKE